MRQITYQYNDPHITFLGRTLKDDIKETTYFDWTCSGFQFQFEGSKVQAQLSALLVEEEGTVLYPWFAVFIDEEEVPHKLIELRGACSWYTLFESDSVEKHQIRLIKRTEAQHSKTGLKQLKIEGIKEIDKSPLKGKHRIEFIGDSLTCGYGNESDSSEEGFKTPQENGWEAYAAQTARAFKADFNCISVSGIGVYSSYTGEDKINDTLLMPSVYEYTDRYVEMHEKRQAYTKWDFNKFIPELIVINLGSNDKQYIKYDLETRLESFKAHYMAFLKQVRACNGKEAKILCCMGNVMPDDFINLYPTIVSAVEHYKQETGDFAIETVTFEEAKPEDGVGGNWHPTIKTHTKMAETVIQKVSEWLGW